MTGQLVLAATPIGNTADASERLRDLLTSADLIAAEDTRRLRALAQRLELTVTAKVIAFHEHNEAERAEQLLDAASNGNSVVVVSDAGMPLISDPGYRLVTAAVQRDIPVTCAPGPSAVLTALALSGLPTDRFCFDGFLPRSKSQRRRYLEDIAQETRTVVVLEAPHRLVAALEDVVATLGERRRIAVCRELTKTYEEVLRGTAAEIAAIARDRELRGEISIVIEGASAEDQIVSSSDDAASRVLELAQGGMRLKDAANLVATETGLRTRELYNQALALQAAQSHP